MKPKIIHSTLAALAQLNSPFSHVTMQVGILKLVMSRSAAAETLLHTEAQVLDRTWEFHLNAARSALATIFNYRSIEALEEKAWWERVQREACKERKSKRKELEAEKGDERANLKGKNECEKRSGGAAGGRVDMDVRAGRRNGERETETEREREMWGKDAVEVLNKEKSQKLCVFVRSRL